MILMTPCCRYLKKAQCIIEQYGNYSIAELENLPVSGINTQVIELFNDRPSHMKHQGGGGGAVYL